MRPSFHLAISGALALCVALKPGAAQEPYPSKPIHLVVTTAAGGCGFHPSW
jgi:tripartite-type tricarboxylate transporter receptor subunit TctC